MPATVHVLCRHNRCRRSRPPHRRHRRCRSSCCCCCVNIVFFSYFWYTKPDPKSARNVYAKTFYASLPTFWWFSSLSFFSLRKLFSCGALHTFSLWLKILNGLVFIVILVVLFNSNIIYFSGQTKNVAIYFNIFFLFVLRAFIVIHRRCHELRKFIQKEKRDWKIEKKA